MDVVLANGNVPVTYKTLPGGWAGTDATVELMGQMATGKWGSRSPKIRALAINIVTNAKVPEKDYVGEMVAIHNWVRDHIRYTRDVSGQETLSYPEEIAFNSQAEDCDGKSMLEAALLGSIGITSRFVTIGVTPFSYSHVYLQAKPKDTWISLDPIMKDKPAGWEVPNRVVKVRKVFPENVPQETTMSGVRGLGNGDPFSWYVGYQGGGYAHSHLSPAPNPRTGAGPGQPVHAPQAASPYVVMDSMLDSDAPIEQISKDMPAFPQQGITQTPGGKLLYQRAQLLDKRIRSVRGPTEVVARVRAEEVNAANIEDDAANPMNGLRGGMHGLMGPEQLAALGYSSGIDRQLPYASMQRPALAQAPEGVDAMFVRPNMVLRTDKGDTLVYRGLYSLAERPPVRPYQGMSGVYDAGSGPSCGMPGMGALPRRISGPGLAELSDLADDAATAAAAAAATAPVPAPAPSISPVAKVGALAAIGLGLYLLLKKKG